MIKGCSSSVGPPLLKTNKLSSKLCTMDFLKFISFKSDDKMHVQECLMLVFITKNLRQMKFLTMVVKNLE